MACVKKRRGKWVLDYRDQNGVRRWETLKDGTRKDADALLAQRMQEVGRGDYRPIAEEKTFEELKDAYVKGHVEVNVRFATRKDYETLIALHLLPYFKGRKVRTITRQDVEIWRGKLLTGKQPDGRTPREEGPVGRRTVNKAHIQLGAMLRYAVSSRWANWNAALEVEKLADEKASDNRPVDENILTPAEVPKLLDAADIRWRPLLLMAVTTGLRQGELLGLRWGDIDWNSREVHVRRQFSKGRFADLKTKHSRRRVGLPDELVAGLKAWKLACPKPQADDGTSPPDDDLLVFPHTDGRPLNHGLLLRQGFYPAMRRAKLRRIRFHDLRHTFASLLIATNVHPKRIQALMGHSTIRVTMDVYEHLMRDADNEAAAKIGALVFSGSKTVAKPSATAAPEEKVLKKLEAGVGIEPAYTALQAAA